MEKINYIFIPHERWVLWETRIKRAIVHAKNHGYKFLIIGKTGVVFTSDHNTFERVKRSYAENDMQILETVTL